MNAFSVQNCPKINFGTRILKVKVLFSNHFFQDTIYANFQEKWKIFDSFGPNLPKNESWDRNFENLSVILESAPPRYYVCQFLDKTNCFVFFDPNLPWNKIWGRDFKNLSPDLESAPQRYHVWHFSGKTDNFLIFHPKFREIAQLLEIFWFIYLITLTMFKRPG